MDHLFARPRGKLGQLTAWLKQHKILFVLLYIAEKIIVITVIGKWVIL